jgi:histidine ammonia-lyase
LSHVSQVVETEINSADDNPLVLLEEEEVFHGGNFHGQPVAMVMDFLKIALTEIGNISERRLERFINPSLNNGLPPFLSPRQPGLDAGFEGSQYAATSLLAESRVLATPASIQSISANAGFQDVVSMGMIAARQALAILDNMEYIVGLEVLAAAQAADLVGPAKLGPASKAVYDIVRAHVPFMDEDRAMFIDLQIARDLVASGEMVQAVENLIGALD